VKVSVAIGALTAYPVSTTLAFANAAGADGVELLVDRHILERGPELYARMALKHGAPILTVHSLLQVRSRDIDSKIQCDRDSIRFAACVPTCDAIVLHPPMVGPRPTPDFNRWLDSISKARAESANPRLKLGIENRGDNQDGIEPQFLDDLSFLRRLTEEWDMSMTLDIAHAASFGLDLFDAIETCLPRLANVHLSDARTKTYHGGIRNGLLRDHLLPGEGVLPLEDVSVALLARRYSGPLTIELSPLSLRAFWPPAARRRMHVAAHTVRELLAQAEQSHEWTRRLPRSAVPRGEETRDDA